MIRSISQNQDASSSVCLSCHHPGHKLEDGNSFINYIVTKGLAQLNPQLKIQIANSHKQFRRAFRLSVVPRKPKPFDAMFRIQVDGLAIKCRDIDGNKDFFWVICAKDGIDLPNETFKTLSIVSTSTELAGYVDAAHATDLATHSLITGLVFMFGDGPTTYKSKILSIVNTEAEFLATILAAKIVKYLWSILLELGYPQLGPTTLFEDNSAES